MSLALQDNRGRRNAAHACSSSSTLDWRDRREAVFLFAQMSAIGPQRTLACALHMSAFDPKRTF